MNEQSLPAKPGVDQPAARVERPGPSKNGPPQRAAGGELKEPAGPVPGPDDAGATPRERPPQQPREEGAGRAGAAGYLRMRVQVEDRTLSVVDSWLVDSELVRPASLPGPYAYEVTRGDVLLHAESVPDVGEFRSFPAPGGEGEQRGHHRYPTTSYEFAARVPVAALTPAALSEIAVVLHRVKEPAPTRRLTEEPLGRQLARELREIGRVEGIPVEALPEQLRPR